MTVLSLALCAIVLSIAAVMWGRRLRQRDDDGFLLITTDRFPAGFAPRDMELAKARTWLSELSVLYWIIWPEMRRIYIPAALAAGKGLPDNALPDKAYLFNGPFQTKEGLKWAQGKPGAWIQLGIPLRPEDREIAAWWFAEEVHSLLRSYLGVYGSRQMLAESSEVHRMIDRYAPRS